MKFKVVAALVATAGAVFALAGCGEYSKQTEQYKDAGVSGANNDKATVIRMPDGYGNIATKCVHGTRYSVIFHSDSSYGALSVTKGC